MKVSSKNMFFKSTAVLLACVALSMGNDSSAKPEIESKELLKTTTTTTAAQSIHYLKTRKPQVVASEVVLPPGGETGWHKHPVPSYGFVLSGSLTVETKDGKTVKYDSGRAVVECVNTLHNGRNLGTVPVKMLVFYTGEAGRPNTVREGEK